MAPVDEAKQARLERARALMMAALDGELQGEEQVELDRLLAESAELRSEWQQMHRVKEVTGTMTYPKPPDEVWDRYWMSTYNRLERGVAWILVSIGAVLLVGYGLWHAVEALFADSDLPPVLRWGVLAMLLGSFILIFSVLREKLRVNRKDPFNEVRR